MIILKFLESMKRLMSSVQGETNLIPSIRVHKQIGGELTVILVVQGCLNVIPTIWRQPGISPQVLKFEEIDPGWMKVSYEIVEVHEEMIIHSKRLWVFLFVSVVTWAFPNLSLYANFAGSACRQKNDAPRTCILNLECFVCLGRFLMWTCNGHDVVTVP
jgi:hypothetical protein